MNFSIMWNLFCHFNVAEIVAADNNGGIVYHLGSPLLSAVPGLHHIRSLGDGLAQFTNSLLRAVNIGSV